MAWHNSSDFAHFLGVGKSGVLGRRIRGGGGENDMNCMYACIYTWGVVCVCVCFYILFYFIHVDR